MPQINTQTTATGLNSLVLQDTMLDKDNDRVLFVTAIPKTLTAGSRQGAIGVVMDRPATNALTSWDGNPDCGIKVQVTNRAVNGTNGATRGLDITARNRDSGTESWIMGSYISAVNSANTIGDATAGQFITDQGGVSTNTYGVVVQDVSQGTSTNTYAIRTTTGTINPASGARKAVLNIASKDTAGFTNLIYAESATLDTAVVGGSMGAVAGYFKCNVNGTDYKIPFNAVA